MQQSNNAILTTKQKRRREYYQKNKLKELGHQRARNLKRAADNAKDYRKRNKQKHSARCLVAYHLKRGNIVRLPCPFCGKKKTEAHHESHKNPLDILWVCKKHHMAIHDKKVRI